jgi:hypothetical protein
MRRFTLAAAVTTAAAIAAAPATANVPRGNGLTTVPASPIGVHCEDGGTYSVKLTRNLGKSAWQVESNLHYVVGVFSVTEYEQGVVVFSETNTFGVKAGLEPLECWGGFIDEQGNGFAIRSTIYPLPGGGN